MNLRFLLSGILLVSFLAVIVLQAQYVLAQEGGDPITSPVTNEEPTLTEQPISTPIVPEPISENPITSPISSPVENEPEQPISSPVPTETETPITSPVTEEPTPTPAPITSPVTEEPTPTPTPTATPISSPVPTPTPTPTATPVSTPISIPVSVDIVNLPSLLGNIFALVEDAVGYITSLITVLVQVTIDVVSTGQANSIVIPQNTVITRVDGQTFDATALVSTIAPTSSIIAPSNLTVLNTLQWGLPGISLQFSNPITLNIFVGNAYNGQTLSIYRSLNGFNGWTTDGLVSSTCVVSNGVCSFQTNRASYFTVGQAVVAQAPTGSNASSGGSSGSSGSSSSSASCNSAKPESAPVLLSAKATGRNQVTLTWSKAKGSVTYYLVAYGTKSGVMIYGNPNVGDENNTTTVINDLSGNTTYYFKVRAGNNCTPGDFSNEVSVWVGGGKFNKPASGYSQEVLGKSLVKQNKTVQEVAEDVPSSQESAIEVVEVSTQKSNIVEKIVGFIKSIFGK